MAKHTLESDKQNEVTDLKSGMAEIFGILGEGIDRIRAEFKIPQLLELLDEIVGEAQHRCIRGEEYINDYILGAMDCFDDRASLYGYLLSRRNSRARHLECNSDCICHLSSGGREESGLPVWNQNGEMHFGDELPTSLRKDSPEEYQPMACKWRERGLCGFPR